MEAKRCAFFELSLKRLLALVRQAGFSATTNEETNTIEVTNHTTTLTFTFTLPMYKEKSGNGVEQYEAITDEVEKYVQNYDLCTETYKNLEPDGHGKKPFPHDMIDVYNEHAKQYKRLVKLLRMLRAASDRADPINKINRPEMLQEYLETIGRQNDDLRADELLEYAEYVQALDYRGEWWGWEKYANGWCNPAGLRRSLGRYIQRLMKELGVTSYRINNLGIKV